MATIDLTLDSFKVPAIESYTPPFGTKIVKTDANKGGLSTVEVNSNIMMPFANMRPKVITENSSTTEIEYDAKLCFSASLLAGATLELDDGAYEGCRLQITNLSSYTCTVEYNSTTLVSIPTGANVEVIWTGSSWMLSTTGTVASGNVMPPTSAAVQAAIDAKMPDYSTTEQPTGRKWIDGKDEYQKSFVLSGTITRYGYTDVGISVPANFASLTRPVQLNLGIENLIYFDNTTFQACTTDSASLNVTGQVATLFYTKSDPTP